MAAYIISRVHVKDPERMKDYAARSIALAKTYGASYPARHRQGRGAGGLL
jgi:Uncharacterized conserved protein